MMMCVTWLFGMGYELISTGVNVAFPETQLAGDISKNKPALRNNRVLPCRSIIVRKSVRRLAM